MQNAISQHSAGGDPQRAPDAQLRGRLGFIQN